MLQTLSCALYPFLSVTIDTIKTHLQTSLNIGQRKLNLSMRKFVDPKAKKDHLDWLVWPPVNWVIHVYFNLMLFSK